MIIREIEELDAEKYLWMLIKLDNETKNMIFEAGERKTSISETKRNIRRKKEEESLILIAESEGEIVGFLSVERGFANRIKHSAYIVIGILERYRGMGIGAKLFDQLDEWAREHYITRLELTVITENKRAIRLYEKKGFKIEGVKNHSFLIDGKYTDEFYMGRLL